VLTKKVFVLTGGSNGIGEATIRLLSSHGSFTVFGDIDIEKGERLQSEFPDLVTFVQTNVTDYDDILKLFDAAYKKHGRVDHAVSNAGIMEADSWFPESLDLETVKETPSTATLNVNLKGTLMFARVAMAYMKEGRTETDDKSLVLMSSIAGFKETPGVSTYTVSKHGVMGLMRSLRLISRKRYGVRINCINPWATKTAMIADFETAWTSMGLPLNEASDISNMILAAASNPDLHGEAILVEGGSGWPIEKNLDRTQPEWMGKEPSDRIEKGHEALGYGTYNFQRTPKK